MNKAILTIGYQTLLVSVEDAGTILNLLATAVPVKRDYNKDAYVVSDEEFSVDVKLLSVAEVAKMALSQ